MRTYRQYCPVARASEILAERWTPLIVRNLMFGADTFTGIAHGVPHMSRSMLAKRLVELEHNGVLERTPKERGQGHHYRLTAAGRDLASTVQALAMWGERWVEIRPEHTDPGFALWAWCQVQLDRSRLPDGRTVVAFTFPEERPGNRHFWLLAEEGELELCYQDPGGEPAAHVVAGSAAFVDWHRGAVSWDALVRRGDVTVAGDRAVTRAFPTWNLRPVPRSAGPASID